MSNADSGQAHQSYWRENQKDFPLPVLQSDITTDVLVIGSGITGLLTAFHLTKAGYAVTVVESHQLIGGNTGLTTAHLTWFLDIQWTELVRIHGEEKTRQVLESHQWAIDFLEHTIEGFGIDCQFARLDGCLFLDPKNSRKDLEKQLGALNKLQISEAAILDEPDKDSWYEGPSLILPGQARFHPLLFLNAIAQKILDGDGEIYVETPIQRLEQNKAYTAQGRTIHAKHIVVATHVPIHEPLFPAKEAAYRSYVVGARIPKGLLRDCLYWDTADPYHYIRLQGLNEEEDLVIVGGEDHKTGQSEQEDERSNFSRLEIWAQKQYPFIKDFDYRWSGQVLETMDGLAYIGQLPKNKEIYAATGFSGNGMTYGVIAGKMLSDLIRSGEHRWEGVYAPSRQPLKSLWEFAGQNLNVAKMFAKDRMPSFKEHPTTLNPDEGVVIAQGNEKMALYKDAHGQVHAFSAVCPHLRCIVHWNGAEKTFDCPCHGSRFSCFGEVLEGPAVQPLTPLNQEVKKSA